MNLDDLEKQVLGHTRREMSPTPEEACRARDALAAQLGAATLSKAATAGATGGFWASLGPIKAALLLVTVLGGASAVVGLSVNTDETRSTAPSAKPAEPVSAPNLEAPAPRSSADDKPPSTPETASPGAPALKRTAIRASKSADEEQPNRLAEEVRLLKRADQAIRQGSPEIARNLLDELSRSYPNGQLLEERAATETLLLCQRTRDRATQAAAREFLIAHPASLYAARIRAACIDLADASEGTPTPGH